jgi:hypothetical protein
MELRPWIRLPLGIGMLAVVISSMAGWIPDLVENALMLALMGNFAVLGIRKRRATGA